MDFFTLVSSLFSFWQVWVATGILFLVFALVKLLTSFDKSALGISFERSKGPIAGPKVLDDAEEDDAGQESGGTEANNDEKEKE